ncbi:MAG TPA: hypothetical protein PLN69_01495 [bacterium]|nr:hypothetical protein [bacterium]
MKRFKILTHFNSSRVSLCLVFSVLLIAMSQNVAAITVTPAGTLITHMKSYATGTGIVGTIESNTVDDIIVDQIFGFASDTFTETGAILLQTSNNLQTEYQFRMTNNGNTADRVKVIFTPGDNVSGIEWSISLDDQGGPLTWNTGGATADPSGDFAISSTDLDPGDEASFTIRMLTDSANYGATMSFSITAETFNSSAEHPAGQYTGFNNEVYAGPGTLDSRSIVPTVAPLLSNIDASEYETNQETITITGTTEPGITGTINVIGPETMQYDSNLLVVGASGYFSKEIALFEGLNNISISVSDWASNTATATIQATRDSTPVVTAFNMPTELTVSPVQIIGKAYDEQNHMSEYTVHYGPGTNPAAWKEIGSGTTGVGSETETGTLAIWDSSGLSGTYTLRLTANQVEPYGNPAVITHTVIISQRIIVSGTVQSKQWTMVSVPGRPTDGDPVNFFDTTGHAVQRWNPTMEDNEKGLKYEFANITIGGAGMGFWVKPFDETVTEVNYEYEVYVTDTAETETIQIYEGWNQFGTPYLNRGSYDGSFTWGSVKVAVNYGTAEEEIKTMTEARDAGWIEGDFYSYEESGYVPYGLSDSLLPKTGYFVNAMRDCSLVFEPGTGLPGGLARIVRPNYDWKMQLSAFTDDSKDTDNFAAALRTAADDYDPSDSSEPPTVEPYVSLYFENEEYGRNAGKLSKDTRSALSKNQSKTWNFVVEVSDPGKAVTVQIPNADTLPDNYRFRVIDEKTGAEFDPKQQQEYVFTADSSARRFALSSQKIGDASSSRISHQFPGGWSMISVPVEPEPTDVKEQLGNQLSNIQVFQYFDREMYEPDSPEKVDIQAGIGYWIHLDEPTTLAFEGIIPEPGTGIEIPLVQGWNLIGNPFEGETVDKDDLLINLGGETVEATEAVERDWLAPYVFSYNSTSGGYERIPIGDPLVSWQGYAIYAKQTCTLIIRVK